MGVEHDLKFTQGQLMHSSLIRYLGYFRDNLFFRIQHIYYTTRQSDIQNQWQKGIKQIDQFINKSKMYQGQNVEVTPTSFPNYSQTLFSKPSLVLQHAKQSCKQLEQFISAFSKRIDIELTYHKNLKDCSKMLDKYIDGNSKKSLSYISSAFKVDNEQRANQAKQLAQSLKTEVIEALNQMNQEFSTMLKANGKTLKKINKEYIHYQENFQRYYQNYKENDIQTKQMLITKGIYKYTSEFTLEKKNKLVSKTMQSVKQKLQYQKLYKQSVKQYNEMIEIYKKQLTEMLNNVQTKERQQIKLQSDCIRKLIVCEISMFKNVEYDLINISKQMEAMDPQNDILHFQKQAETTQTKEVEKNLILKEVESDKSLLTMSLKNVQDEYFSWLHSVKKNPNLRIIIEKRHKQLKKVEEESLNEDQLNKQWISLPKDFFDSGNEQINPQSTFFDFLQLTELINEFWVGEIQGLKEKLSHFNQYLNRCHLLRILSYLFIEQYRTNHHVQLNQINFIQGSKLISSFINQCEAKNDSFVVKGLLGLLFTFSGTKQNAKKLLYQTQPVFSCSIWKRDDFWQATIFESTYEQMYGFASQKGETQAQTLLREKNNIFSQLASYCHYMLMLGIQPKTVKVVVGRYCRLYQMTTQQNTDLSKMIRSTFRQIKDNQINQTITFN